MSCDHHAVKLSEQWWTKEDKTNYYSTCSFTPGVSTGT